MYLPKTYAIGRMGHKVIFQLSKSGWNSVFSILDWLPHQGKKISLSNYLPRDVDGEQMDSYLHQGHKHEMKIKQLFSLQITLMLGMPPAVMLRLPPAVMQSMPPVIMLGMSSAVMLRMPPALMLGCLQLLY